MTQTTMRSEAAAAYEHRRAVFMRDRGLAEVPTMEQLRVITAARNAAAVATGTAGNAGGVGEGLDDVDREAAALFGYSEAVAQKFKEAAR